MTIFDWCDKHPREELIFMFDYASNDIFISCDDANDEISLAPIKDLLTEDKNMKVSVKLSDKVYNLKVTCEYLDNKMSYLKRIPVLAVKRFNAADIDFILSAILRCAENDICNRFLGRD